MNPWIGLHAADSPSLRSRTLSMMIDDEDEQGDAGDERHDPEEAQSALRAALDVAGSACQT